MKIIITESQVPKAMKVYVEKRFPTLAHPLKKVIRDVSDEERKYLTFDSDFTWTDYEDDNGEIWVVEFNKEEYDAQFTVKPELEHLYSLFGVENFENYFKKVHGINLRGSDNEDDNWIFQ